MSTARHHPRPSSMVMTRIGGEDYPLKSVPQCRTCQSPHRLLIEADLIKGLSYANIARNLEALAPGHMSHPNALGIADHVKNGHIPIGAATQRRLIERRAIEAGKSIEDESGSLADYVTLNQMIVHRTFERMQAGDLTPNISEGLAASKFLFQVDQSVEGGIDEQTWRDALMAYLEMAQQFIPQERWQDYAAALNGHPVLRAIANASERKQLESSEQSDT